MIGQNRQAGFQQAKADRDYSDVNRLLVENTELTRAIHLVTEEVHQRLLTDQAAPQVGPAESATDAEHHD
jgi:hypothetical protein